jgi:hypothetical protein
MQEIRGFAPLCRAVQTASESALQVHAEPAAADGALLLFLLAVSVTGASRSSDSSRRMSETGQARSSGGVEGVPCGGLRVALDARVEQGRGDERTAREIPGPRGIQVVRRARLDVRVLSRHAVDMVVARGFAEAGAGLTRHVPSRSKKELVARALTIKAFRVADVLRRVPSRDRKSARFGTRCWSPYIAVLVTMTGCRPAAGRLVRAIPVAAAD